MSNLAPVIAVDGPSGVGKGTLCRRLALTLGWHLLDSGALYRLTATAAIRDSIALDDVPALVELAGRLRIIFVPESSDITRVMLKKKDVSERIRTEEIGDAASKVAVFQPVRDALLIRQRDFRQPPGLIADGRDMGTVVFPDAGVKLFLNADAEARAERRFKQLRESGINAKLSSLVKDIAGRDSRDSNRSAAPLKPASDATVIDTTNLSIEQVYQQCLAIVEHTHSV